MKRQMLILAVSLLVALQPVWGRQEVTEVTGSIRSVIVYRGQALVTRTIEVDLPQGASDVVVTKLPEKIVTTSLHARASGQVGVRSVRYRKTKAEETGQEVKELETKIEQVKTQIKHAKRNIQHCSNLWKRYDPFWHLTLNTANKDFDRALLQSQPIVELTGYLEEKLNQLHKKSLELEDKEAQLKKELKQLNREKAKLLEPTSKTKHEAVIFVNSQSGGGCAIELSYLVNRVNWYPQYNLRARPAESRVAVEYNAFIHQSSGEDWDGVTLSLSTAAAAMEAAPPILELMEIKLLTGPTLESKRGLEEAGQAAAPYKQRSYADLSDEFKQVQQSRRQMSRKGKAAERALNVAAVGSQMLELQADKLGVEILRKETRKYVRREGVSVTYMLGDGFSIPSRTGQELVTIAAFESKADFLTTGTPMLTDYVYLQADITNDSDTILLAGPVSMYRDGEFVGKSKLELVTIGEEFTAGFGVDSQVQISREFKDKKVNTLWGNRIEKYEYRIAIDNYKNTAVKLRLVERIPYTEDKGIEISGFKTNVALSKDPDYVRTQKDKGILRWDLNLAANTTDDKAKVITYSYTMKYDKDKHVEAAGLSR